MAGRRMELGFDGGMVLRVTLDDGAVDGVSSGLTSAKGWFSLTSEEGQYWVNVDELAYVRLAPGDAPSRVGFAGD
jgi:Protein of unknown function (DUF3107)